jgi:hypothetical protein
MQFYFASSHTVQKYYHTVPHLLKQTLLLGGWAVSAIVAVTLWKKSTAKY